MAQDSPGEMQHAAAVLSNATTMKKKLAFCDYKIKAQGRTFNVHRLILAANSGYFRTIFHLDDKKNNLYGSGKYDSVRFSDGTSPEYTDTTGKTGKSYSEYKDESSKYQDSSEYKSKSGEKTETYDYSESSVVKSKDSIEIKKFDAERVEQCIEFMYTGTCNFELNKVQGLLEIAGYLDMPIFKEKCYQFMLDYLSPETCFPVLNLARTLEAKKVVAAAEEMIRNNLSEVIHSDQFRNICKGDLFHYIDNASYEDSWNAIKTWCKYHEDEFLAIATRINFRGFPFDILLYNVLKEPLVSKYEEIEEAVHKVLFSDLKRLEKNLNCSNCFHLKRVCTDDNASKVIDAFAKKNFPMIVSHQDLLCSLPKDDVVTLLQSPDIKPEESKWNAALQWVSYDPNRIPSFPDLFRSIRLGLIDAEFLEYEIHNHSLVKNSVECMRLLMDGVLNHARSIPEQHEVSTAISKARQSYFRSMDHPSCDIGTTMSRTKMVCRDFCCQATQRACAATQSIACPATQNFSGGPCQPLCSNQPYPVACCDPCQARQLGCCSNCAKPYSNGRVRILPQGCQDAVYPRQRYYTTDSEFGDANPYAMSPDELERYISQELNPYNPYGKRLNRGSYPGQGRRQKVGFYDDNDKPSFFYPSRKPLTNDPSDANKRQSCMRRNTTNSHPTGRLRCGFEPRSIDAETSYTGVPVDATTSYINPSVDASTSDTKIAIDAGTSYVDPPVENSTSYTQPPINAMTYTNQHIDASTSLLNIPVDAATSNLNIPVEVGTSYVSPPMDASTSFSKLPVEVSTSITWERPGTEAQTEGRKGKKIPGRGRSLVNTADMEYGVYESDDEDIDESEMRYKKQPPGGHIQDTGPYLKVKISAGSLEGVKWTTFRRKLNIPWPDIRKRVARAFKSRHLFKLRHQSGSDKGKIVVGSIPVDFRFIYRYSSAGDDESTTDYKLKLKEALSQEGF